MSGWILHNVCCESSDVMKERSSLPPLVCVGSPVLSSVVPSVSFRMSAM